MALPTDSLEHTDTKGTVKIQKWSLEERVHLDYPSSLCRNNQMLQGDL